MYPPSHHLSKTSAWLTFPPGLWGVWGSVAETHSSLLKDGVVVNNNKDNGDTLDAQSQQEEEKPAGSQAARWRDAARRVSEFRASKCGREAAQRQPIAAGFDQLTLLYFL